MRARNDVAADVAWDDQQERTAAVLLFDDETAEKSGGS
jgi:hypothetical protein